MSQSDGFVDEVTDALRRDRLYRTMRRWAPLAVLLVLVLVGGTAFREWRLSRADAEARALGDALLASLEAGDADALRALPAEGPAAALLALLASAAGETPDPAALEAVASDPDMPPRYRDLAVLKAVAATPDAPAAERRERLEAIAGPGAPYRLLAEERLALLAIEEGDADAAVARLRAILDDAETTPALRDRAGQLLVALGAELDAA